MAISHTLFVYAGDKALGHQRRFTKKTSASLRLGRHTAAWALQSENRLPDANFSFLT